MSQNQPEPFAEFAMSRREVGELEKQRERENNRTRFNFLVRLWCGSVLGGVIGAGLGGGAQALLPGLLGAVAGSAAGIALGCVAGCVRWAGLAWLAMRAEGSVRGYGWETQIARGNRWDSFLGFLTVIVALFLFCGVVFGSAYGCGQADADRGFETLVLWTGGGAVVGVGLSIGVWVLFRRKTVESEGPMQPS